VIHVLLIHPDGSAPETLREVLAPPRIRAVVRRAGDEAAASLERGAFDAALVQWGEPSAAQKDLRAIRARDEALPIIALGPRDDADEAAALDAGADLCFADPAPARPLARLIERFGAPRGHPGRPPEPGPPAAPAPPRAEAAAALPILRDFSHILGYSLDYKAFTRAFIRKLRDYLSFSRIGIFLEHDARRAFVAESPSRELECVASFGLPHDLVDCFQLSREVGVGRAVAERQRIVRGDDAAARDPAAAKELGVLGCELAIPISDRERPVGLAVLSGPVTGRRYTEEELHLLCMLMEELGLAVRNSRLHSQLAAHGRLIEDVLKAMASGALVVGSDTRVLYANDAAKAFAGLAPDDPRPLDFGDLPESLASPIHRAIRDGASPAPFMVPGASTEKVFRATLIPFPEDGAPTAQLGQTLVIVEDFTAIEADKSEVERRTRSDLLHRLAERFAHEIRNSLVPLATHAQLIDQKIDQPGFRASLKNALQRETGRIERLSEQMLRLSGPPPRPGQEVRLGEIMRAAFEDARRSAPSEGALELAPAVEEAIAPGDPDALRDAFGEIFLNALQAAETEARIEVDGGPNAEGRARFRIRDSGPGFTADAAARAAEPFFTTRATGVGLGLCVAQKIIEDHNGALLVYAKSSAEDPDLEIQLPAPHPS